ncbi:bacteriocin immunity protein [Pseudomonas sp. P1.8]|jgi:hypothetical protein|nr:bacteriocin immunity protein [Pseudomonas sp. P1.8]WPN44900.1 bacteriocin immunity protein [Pseudomonas sp. P8_241]
MELKATLKDYTQSEFQALVNRIWAVDLPRQDHDRLIEHFDRICGHPKGADLLFYPDDKVNSHSAESVVYYVRNWHHEKGEVKARAQQSCGSSFPVAPTVRSTRSVFLWSNSCHLKDRIGCRWQRVRGRSNCLSEWARR